MKRLSLAAMVALSCHALTPRQQHAQDVFLCRAAALAPFLGGVYDAEQLVRETAAGKLDPVALIVALGGNLSDVQAAAEAWNACNPQPLVAPVPGSGDKVVSL